MAQSKKTPAKKTVTAKAKPSAKKTIKTQAKPVTKAKPATKPVAKAKNNAKPVVKGNTKVAAKPIAKKVPAPVAKKSAKPAVKAIARPVTKTISKAVPKKAALPVAKKATKPSPQKATKPMPKSGPKKVAPPISKKVEKPALKKVAPAPAKIGKPAAKPASKPAIAATPPPSRNDSKPAPAPAKQDTGKAASTPVAQKVAEKKPPFKKSHGKKSSKPVETYEGKRVVRFELPAKALITIQKPEEEVHMDTPHYEYPTLRYSDAELKEFKELIETKLAAQREELKNLKDSLESHTESQIGNKSWNMEEGSDTSEMEYLMNQIARLNKFIRDLEMALVRIENKTYGICRATGKLIDKNRLRVVPHATLSMEAKMSRKTDDIPNTSQTPAAHMGSEGEGFGAED